MDLVPFAGAMARVGNDRQMAETLDRRDDAEVERVARVVGERADAALAQDHVVVAFRQDVLGGHQEFFERGRHAALEQHRFARPSGVAQQGEVLHVASADLDAVGILDHEVERLDVDGFGDDAKTRFLAGLGEQSEPLFAEALKRIGRRAGLIGAAAQQLGAAGFYGAG